MKTKHLFSFFVFLALTSSGILLTDLPSIAEPKPASENQILASPTLTPSDAVSSPTPSPSGEIKAIKSDGNESLTSLTPIISGLSALLHLLEVAGLVWAYLKINQLTEKSRDSRSQIKNLIDKLNASEQHQKSQGDQLKKISSESTNTRDLTSRINAIEQATQRKSNDISYADSGYNLSNPGLEKATVAPSPYSFLDTYRRSPDNFKNQYSPKIVSEDADNLQKRWSGDHQEIILGEDRSGNYWLFNENSAIYLIPSPKLKVNDMNMRTAGSLFDCNNYTPGYQSMTVVRPAIVSSQPGANERWKLEQKGVLEFT